VMPSSVRAVAGTFNQKNHMAYAGAQLPSL
jgi:hypothetical protein